MRPRAAGVPGVTLRGAFGYGVSAGTDRDVALYIDGIFLGGAQGAVFDLADIEQIEVLKGPQGTLFGRASTAGAINITTHSPKGSFAVHQELTYGNFNQFRSKTRVDLPASVRSPRRSPASIPNAAEIRATCYQA